MVKMPPSLKSPQSAKSSKKKITNIFKFNNHSIPSLDVDQDEEKHSAGTEDTADTKSTKTSKSTKPSSSKSLGIDDASDDGKGSVRSKRKKKLRSRKAVDVSGHSSKKGLDSEVDDDDDDISTGRDKLSKKSADAVDESDHGSVRRKGRRSSVNVPQSPSVMRAKKKAIRRGSTGHLDIPDSPSLLPPKSPRKSIKKVQSDREDSPESRSKPKKRSSSLNPKARRSLKAEVPDRNGEKERRRSVMKTNNGDGDDDDDDDVSRKRRSRSADLTKQRLTRPLREERREERDRGDTRPAAASSDNDRKRAIYLQKQLQEALLRAEKLTEEHRRGQAEASKVTTELFNAKMDLKKAQTEKLQLKKDVRDYEDMLEAKDSKIEKLEKAVESQLDHVDDLAEELRRAEQEITRLEGEVNRLEAEVLNMLSGRDHLQEVADDMQRRLDEKRLQRLEEREAKLAEKERAVTDLKIKMAQRHYTPDDSLDTMRDELKKLKEKSAAALEEKDEAIAELQRQLEEAQKATPPEGGVLLPKKEKKPWHAADDNYELVRLRKENEELRELLKSEKAQADASMKAKDDKIEALQIEVEDLKREGNEGLPEGEKALRDELSNTKSQLKYVMSQWDGAQRRNVVLEDDIEHWKSVNCGLEDEIHGWKSEAAEWKSKYVQLSRDDGSPGDGDKLAPGNLGRALARMKLQSTGPGSVGTCPPDIGNSSGHGDSASVNGLQNLWSKLVTPNQKPLGSNSTH